MSEVKLPGVGGVSKKALTIGGLAAAAVVTLFYLRKRSSSTSAASSTAGAATDPNAIDPATGLTYAAEAAGGSDYVDPGLQDTSGGPTYGATGYMDPNTGQWVYGNTGTGQAAATTNAQWSQNAISYLTQNSGTDPGALGAALGAYLAGHAVTSAQEGLIDQAIAVEGYPPSSSTTGYPPGIRTSDTGGGAGGTGGSGGGVTGGKKSTVPHVVGEKAGAAHNAIVAAGLHPIADPGQKATWIVTSTTPAAGKTVNSGTRVLITAKAPAPAKKK